jgi:hypothetical protein
MRNYDEGSRGGYVELPVPAAWVRWARGDAKLATIKNTDPAAYFGGWRAFLQHKDKSSNAQVDNPKLPLPVVERVSESGEHPYTVYATNVLHFLPLNYRLRYEYREKIKDEQTGRETEKVVASSPDKKPGYQPNKQIFGLVFSHETDTYAPAILFISTWSAFISLNKAAEAWKKVKVPEGQILIRRYGSIGVTKDGGVTPKFEIYGQGRSTPIDAVGTDKPRFIADSPVFDKLFDDSVAWKNCSAWNAEGKVTEEDPANGGNPDLMKFDQLADEAGLSNIEKAQLVSEANGDYKKAIESLSYSGEPTMEDINTMLSGSEDFG